MYCVLRAALAFQKINVLKIEIRLYSLLFIVGTGVWKKDQVILDDDDDDFDDDDDDDDDDDEEEEEEEEEKRRRRRRRRRKRRRSCWGVVVWRKGGEVRGREV
jgi:hypothetical protein